MPIKPPIPKRILIVGGVAGGATAAARLRRLDESAEIVLFERGPHVSFASCGVPYRVGGHIERSEGLILQTPESLAKRYRLDVHVNHEVVGIRRAERLVTVADVTTGRVFEERYDALILSPGARPLIPDIPGARDERVLTVRSIEDAERILALANAGGRAVVIGGGFVGVEIAENLIRHGVAVTLVEAQPGVLPFLDPELASRAGEALARGGVDVRTATKVTGFGVGERLAVALEGAEPIVADLAIFAVGVVPETRLARDAGLALGARGGITVDAQMRTSDPAIFAVGDAVEVEHAVLGTRCSATLAGPANRQARVAADAIVGLASSYRGALATSIVRAFDTTFAATGASARQLRQAGIAFRSVTVHAAHHVSWFPGASDVHLTLHYGDDGRLLGAQAAGEKGVDKRIDVLAIAIRHGATVHDLLDEELAYAPPFGAPKDPIQLAGMVATNDLSGLAPVVDVDGARALLDDGAFLLDVRTADEHASGAIEGAALIPIDDLRARVDALPRDRTILVYCAVGRRGYVAQRMLMQRGFSVVNLTGGYTSWSTRHRAAAESIRRAS